jgi:hypothetical protein
MKAVAHEIGQAVRAALQGWPETLRLCVLMMVTAIIWAALLIYLPR